MAHSNDRHGGRTRPPAVPPTEASGEPSSDRIAKVIARAGIASRRDAEAMIAEGRVRLNGEVLASPAINVGQDDRILVDGEPLPSRERTRLWLFHKPRGLVTTFRDPQGRPTVFEALPDEMPRVVAIGRLDINTEGLLLLTNDGGLAKVIAHPETGWARRYRVRAHGDVDQAALDRLARGITVDGIEYGPITATLDRVQGDNAWLTLTLREGKNREIKRVLEHIGVQVTRLIRLSFGPFQLGDLEQGLVEEIRTRVLKDQLGQTLAEQAGVDFESPVREPIEPFGRAEPEARARVPRDGPARVPRPRSAGTEREPGRRPGRYDGEARPPRRRDDAERRPDAPRPGRRAPGPASWRAEDERPEARPRKVGPRREDPRADRAASATRERQRVGAIRSPEGRKVTVERLVAEERPAKRPRATRPDGAERPDGRAARPRRDDGPHSGPDRSPERWERPRGGDARDDRRGAPPGRGKPPGRGGPPNRSAAWRDGPGGPPGRGAPRAGPPRAGPPRAGPPRSGPPRKGPGGPGGFAGRKPGGPKRPRS